MKEPIFEVFARKGREEPLRHIGFINAMDGELARVYAWKTYDEQVANFMNGEVLVQRCWEPAVKQVKAEGQDVEYATCSDFHINWMHSTGMAGHAACSTSTAWSRMVRFTAG